MNAAVKCVVVLLAAVGLAVVAGCGGGSDEAAAPEQVTVTVTTGTPTVSEPPAPTIAPPTTDAAPPAPSGDTGRMSEGEWESAGSAVTDVNEELRQYVGRLGDRCATLAGAGEVAAYIDCVDEAYDGLEVGFAITVDRLEGLEGDVSGKCLKVLRIAGNLVNEPLYQAAQASHRALIAVDNGATTRTLGALRLQRNRWDKTSGDMLQLCAPA